ncbi:hypothetical protein FB382_000462 [Nocardioides ginsengisegetis]|uniref:Uncharacterized protein n=1 Tax=Nocardioides ginsengisegetis TaxID=661491 RepID=A0A7W3IX03_9ACTN|nr:hypothetical protein [Nocardioides ginsengisegetis]MBA8802171.1 hypothetical protein [Nocardioides ginsengisegetis]
MGDTTDARPLRPLLMAAWGMGLVAIDFNINGLDLVPDPIGWALALMAALRLASRHAGFRWAAGAAGLALLVSLPSWVGVSGAVLSVASYVASTGFVFAVCTALIALVPHRASGAQTIRWADVALTVLVPLVAWTAGPGSTPAVVLLVLAGLTVFVCFIVLMVQSSRDPLVPVG